MNLLAIFRIGVDEPTGKRSQQALIGSA